MSIYSETIFTKEQYRQALEKVFETTPKGEVIPLSLIPLLAMTHIQVPPYEYENVIREITSYIQHCGWLRVVPAVEEV